MARERRATPRLSLAAKFNVMTIGLVVVAAVTLTGLTLRWQLGWQRDALVTTGRAMARMMAMNAELGIYTSDAETLAGAASGMDAEPSIQWVAIHDKEGRLVHYRCRDGAPCGSEPPVPLMLEGFVERVRNVRAEDSDDTYLEITVPVFSAGLLEDQPRASIGHVRLGIPMAIVDRTAAEVLWSTAPAALLLVFLSVVISVVLSSRLMGPVQQLVKATQRVRAGAFDEIVSVPGDAELAALAIAFNDMVERLSAYRDEVEAHRTDLEARVEERTVSLRNAVEEARAQAKRAEEASRTKSAFLANMSHELRTPLNAIIGYAEMLLEDSAAPIWEEANADLESIRRAGRHLLGLINDVLDLSRIEAGYMRADVTDFDLGDVLGSLEAIVRPMAEAHRNDLRVRVPPSAGSMRSDPTRLKQIVLNLLSNACKFTREGDVQLWVRCEEADIVFCVTDTGPGIPIEMLDRVFEPFVQVDNSSTREVDGTGLGLPISRRFAEMLGGTLTCESVKGQGSTFTLTLPRSLPALPEEHAV